MVDLEKLQDAIPDITGKSYYWGKLAREAHDELAALRAEHEMVVASWKREELDWEATEKALRARVAELEAIIAEALRTANGRWCEWGGRAESVRDVLERATESAGNVDLTKE